MRKTILVIERIVIESLESKGRRLDELEEHTGLENGLLKAVLFKLIEQGVLTYQGGIYELNWSQKKDWLPLVKDQEGMKAEIKELFSSLVNLIFKKEGNALLRVKKVWLEPQEQDELSRRLKEIDLLLENIRNRRTVKPVKEVTKGKKVLFYGVCGYEDLVDGVLKAS